MADPVPSGRIAPAGGRAARSIGIPLQPTPLIGREQVLAAACVHLRHPDVRLLTLTGPGGVGKTRLAVAVAAQLWDDFAHGAFMVDLAPLRDPSLLTATIAQSVGVREQGDQAPATVLAHTLRDKQVLLVLDNFEHLLGAAPTVAELLAACSGLHVLVTSRVPLHLRWEHELPVPPLALPGQAPGRLPPFDALITVPAIALFLQRARAVAPDFVLDEQNAAAVAGICVRLDGLPLAIELAAARSKVLPPQAILSRLAHRLAFLTGGPPDLPARLRTMHDAIAWSYDLLSPGEQQLFRRLAVFVGGFTLEEAVAVCNAEGDLSLDVLDGVAALVEKSLVVRVEGGTDEPRFAMLATIHEFALARLATSGEAERMRERHARTMLASVRQESRALRSAAASAAGTQLVQELENIRAALRWCVEQDDAALGSRLSWSMEYFWHRRGLTREGREWAERLLALPSAAGHTITRARLLRAAAEATSTTTDMTTTRRYAAESVAISRALGDMACLAQALRVLGWSHLQQGEFGAARACFEQCLPLLRELGDWSMVVAVLGYLATTADRDGDAEAARAYAIDALQAARGAGDPWMIGYALRYLGILAQAAGDDARARELLEESVQLFRSSGDSIDGVKAINALARHMVRQGDVARAAELIGEGLRIGRALGEPVEMLETLEDAAALAARRGDPAGGARLAGATAAMRDERGVPRHHELRAPYDDTLAAMRAALGEDTFQALWSAGRMLRLDEAVAEAVSLAETGVPREDPSHHDGGRPAGAAGEPVPRDGLSAREVEVLHLLCRGLSNREIAEALVVSGRTVVHHVEHIYRKIGARNRAEAVAHALRHGLAGEPPADR